MVEIHPAIGVILLDTIINTKKMSFNPAPKREYRIIQIHHFDNRWL